MHTSERGIKQFVQQGYAITKRRGACSSINEFFRWAVANERPYIVAHLRRKYALISFDAPSVGPSHLIPQGDARCRYDMLLARLGYQPNRSLNTFIDNVPTEIVPSICMELAAIIQITIDEKPKEQPRTPDNNG